ncbi:MAG: RidA family protein, partial [Pseudomonadota bacterium]|nr:RidA family protein [Pseudomonadota bacterium]
MALEKINPQTIVPPFNDAYHHTVVIPAGGRIAHISGQVGLRKDGTVSDDAEDQIEQTWKNVVACVEAAEMTVGDIVKITAYLVNVDDYSLF